tara:strand:- start:1959 stop:2120 length:162 start_codon:yes stop_codon:yes gene_type:complete
MEMKIKTIKRFLEMIKKGLTEKQESIARVHFLVDELDNHQFLINRESRRDRQA